MGWVYYGFQLIGLGPTLENPTQPNPFWGVNFQFIDQ